MRSLSFHSDIRSVAALSFIRAEPHSLPSPKPEAVSASCARRLGKKKTKKKDSIALAPSFVFIVIYAGPFIRCATKDLKLLDHFLLFIVLCDYCCVCIFQMSSLFSSAIFIVLSKTSLSKLTVYVLPSL